MRFFKQNSYDIVKLFINQVGISIFSLFLYFAVGALNLNESSSLLYNILISAFSILFFFTLIYLVAWDLGAKDKAHIDVGHLSKDYKKGAKLSFFANLPNMAFGTFSALGIGLHIMTGHDGFSVFASVFSFLLRIFTAQYNGVLQGIFAGVRATYGDVWYLFWQSIGFIILPLISIPVTWLGYYFGSHDMQIKHLFRHTSA